MHLLKYLDLISILHIISYLQFFILFRMLAGMMQYDAVKAQYQFKIEVQIIQDTAA